MSHPNNAPVHKCFCDMDNLKDLTWESLEYPQALASSDYNQFPNLKKFLSGKFSGLNEDFIVPGMDILRPSHNRTSEM